MEDILSFFQSELFGQLIGFLGTAMVALGMQCKSYNKVVFVRTANAFISALHYLLIGGYTGMAVNLASVGSNVIYWDRIRRKKSTLVYQILFGTLFVVLGCLSWHGPISLLVVAAKLISSVSMGINNTKVIRILNLFSTPCWLMYNIFVGSIAGMCSDVLMLTSIIIGLIRVDIIGARRERERAAAALASSEEKEREV